MQPKSDSNHKPPGLSCSVFRIRRRLFSEPEVLAGLLLVDRMELVSRAPARTCGRRPRASERHMAISKLLVSSAPSASPLPPKDKPRGCRAFFASRKGCPKPSGWAQAPNPAGLIRSLVVAKFLLFCLAIEASTLFPRAPTSKGVSAIHLTRIPRNRLLGFESQDSLVKLPQPRRKPLGTMSLPQEIRGFSLDDALAPPTEVYLPSRARESKRGIRIP